MTRPDPLQESRLTRASRLVGSFIPGNNGLTVSAFTYNCAHFSWGWCIVEAVINLIWVLAWYERDHCACSWMRETNRYWYSSDIIQINQQ